MVAKRLQVSAQRTTVVPRPVGDWLRRVASAVQHVPRGTGREGAVARSATSDWPRGAEPPAPKAVNYANRTVVSTTHSRNVNTYDRFVQQRKWVPTLAHSHAATH